MIRRCFEFCLRLLLLLSIPNQAQKKKTQQQNIIIISSQHSLHSMMCTYGCCLFAYKMHVYKNGGIVILCRFLGQGNSYIQIVYIEVKRKQKQRKKNINEQLILSPGEP